MPTLSELGIFSVGSDGPLGQTILNPRSESCIVNLFNSQILVLSTLTALSFHLYSGVNSYSARTRPTIYNMFLVTSLCPLSWPPTSRSSPVIQYIPSSCHPLLAGHPNLMYREDTPFKEPNLWPTSINMSDSPRSPLSYTRNFPIACAESVWNSTFNYWKLAATLTIGYRSPESLLTIMRVTRKVCPGWMSDMTSKDDKTCTKLIGT